MVEVWSIPKRGGSFCRTFTDQDKLTAYLTTLRRPAKVKSAHKTIGEVWKEGKRWNWYFDPSVLTPNGGK